MLILCEALVYEPEVDFSMNCSSLLTVELTALWMLCSQVPTECERSPSLWQHVQEKTSSWDATCPVPWTASPMWWSGSSMECLFPFLSTFASTLPMWTRNMQVRYKHVCTVTSNQCKNVYLFEAIYCYEMRLNCGNAVGSAATVITLNGNNSVHGNIKLKTI